MANQIKTVYVVHHSHTDIGYTDLQERVIQGQVNYIRTVLDIMSRPENDGFRWNCETWFCVEEFLKTAGPEEKNRLFELMRDGKVGLSANYLNFCDLVDSDVLNRRLGEVRRLLLEYGVQPKTAMIADINGISMGQRDALLANGVEFLFTNIHCHHGMYPLYQNQNAYWWENASGQRLLVWNGEHYNLGNVLGIRPNRAANFMTRNHFGEREKLGDDVDELHRNLEDYLKLCEDNDYDYDFIVTAVSGVFSDNAPPEPLILRVIEEYNRRYAGGAKLLMVSLQELYSEIKEKLAGSPVYRGDLTDWWASGAGSTPYAVKHYRDAQRRYALCRRLDGAVGSKYPELCRTAEDNLLLYAEHTWGHSSTITNPYDTMVLNLDMRKNSYASKAHESASRMLGLISEEKGDIMRYYNTNGELKVCVPNHIRGRQPVEFYVESHQIERARVVDGDGRELVCQVSPHPRGRRVTFVDDFDGVSERKYTFSELPAKAETLNSRKCYVGAERIRDIVNDYDSVTYKLPYGFENQFFSLSYRVGEGITGFVNKLTGEEMLAPGAAPFFTPIYERTPVRVRQSIFPCCEEQERRILGRNIRGEHVELHIARLEEVTCREHGEVFTELELKFSLEGTVHCSVFIKLYEAIPKIDFRLELGKTISADVESVFMPLSLSLEKKQALYIRKGAEAFRPGTDQIPGTCMEYYMSDSGIAYIGSHGSILVASPDVPLLYIGEMRHHPIKLCDNLEENNSRPVYSWVMNNLWETNFKMDLSGFGEYCYSLYLSDESEPEKAMDELAERQFAPYSFITG